MVGAQDSLGARRGLPLTLRPLGRRRAGRIAPGLLRASLLLAPHEVLRLEGRLPAQPLLKDAPALALPQAG
ncbi:hypothetical protein Slala03_78920 [Streptomyces lavendulae subsp. lavendulae]|uniref:hypothetical protein n=1 Tax=Streptomyces lavendulae TaxID=1914 RepID=UPI0024A06C6B|nr:hypothetical protein [Streptomyces lavendulae]GLV88203.1 hypothetical protein Slala03_78920 [Streptomyces lavendulae subsp. lavendulae]